MDVEKQLFGTIKGTVSLLKDNSKLKDAKVKVSFNDKVAAPMETTTNADGMFEFKFKLDDTIKEYKG